MGYMPDGNSVALRRYEAEQARDASLWDSYAEGIAQYWTDEILDGCKANGYTLHDLVMDYLASDEVVPIFVLSGDKRQCAIEDAEKRLRERIKEFFLQHCSDDIWEVIGSDDE